MTSPLAWIGDDALLSEAVNLMRERDVGHLVVKRAAGGVAGIIRAKDLVRLHRSTEVLLQRALRAAASVAEVAEKRAELLPLASGLLESGAKPRYVSRIVSSVSDLVLERLVEFAVAELGPVPAAFSFLALGSEGRREQVGNFDQDNALLFIGVENAPYFLEMGAKACGWLDGMGVPYCKGGVMAKNPSWCVAYETWEGYFRGWIGEPEPERLLDCNIFFDFRGVAGDKSLAERLRESVHEALSENPAFFNHLAAELLKRKIPVYQARLPVDLKEATASITAFARLYALRHGIRETNTLERLEALLEKGMLKKSAAEDLIEAWTFLLGLRMRRGGSATVNPEDLGKSDDATLRASFSEIALLNKRVAFDFPAAAL